LLGADVFWNLLGSTKIPTNLPGLFLYETQLGFIVGGKIRNVLARNGNIVCNLTVDKLDKLTKFWELEKI
jgi:hypothetical protein